MGRKELLYILLYIGVGFVWVGLLICVGIIVGQLASFPRDIYETVYTILFGLAWVVLLAYILFIIATDHSAEELGKV